uniref:Sialate O-acetylesterase domain-containing protein n=1 Tax=Araucaria cunninghamii TaxID=56994 RepID=A0A0D6R729_ARACU
MVMERSDLETIPLADMDIFVLSGQSNMAGRGGVHNSKWDNFIPPECQPHPSILRLNAHLKWEKAHPPLHADIDIHKTCGVGPGLIFANTLLEKNYKDPEKACIGLIPCAIGGTAIREWMKGSHLYNNMIHRTKAALAKGGVLRAILWYQGESDAVEKAADNYPKNLERLIHDIRSDLNLPNLLFIQVAINMGDPPYSKLVQKVREAQLGLNIPNVYCVDAKGLPLKEDKLHLTTEAQVQLGKLLADAYIEHASSHESYPMDCSGCFQGLRNAVNL